MRQDIRGRQKCRKTNRQQDIEIYQFFREPSEEIHSNKRLQRYAIGLIRISMVKHKERRVDALALRADERRDKLRKASGSCK